MSFFLIRLLQQVRGFELAPEAHPAGSLPPAKWKQGRGRQAIEKIWPASAVTAYIKVCFPSYAAARGIGAKARPGWIMGTSYTVAELKPGQLLEWKSAN